MTSQRPLRLLRSTALLAALAVCVTVGAEPAASQVPAAPAVETVPGYQTQLQERRALRRLPEPEPAGDTDDPDAGIQRLELDGLIVDETITRVGQDFYDVFFRFWEVPEGAFNFTVAIQEQPLPQLGTLLTVRVNDEIVFQARLLPQAEQINVQGYQAVLFARRHLQNRAAVPVTF